MDEEGDENCHSSDSDSNSLKIAIENESPKKNQKQFDGRDLDKTIEETIEKCENITPEVAKKMLLKLIKNEHILALSLLKAEELEFNDNRKASESDDDDKKSENEAPATPKLTRLKAKQLNQTLPIPGSLKATGPCEDVVSLIHAELKSDDEDDEYQPCESDEDINNQTLSDIESQPSTPGSALFQSEQDIDSPEKNCEFKESGSDLLSAEEQENISRRTRSKLCLTTTPIETIESAFIPPDITTDMYDFDQDHEVDNDWMGFLSEFLMPLNNAEEDDEKSDPEYIAESVPVDKEELRPVRVSKKELNQLISELLEDTSLNFDSEPSTSYKRNSYENQLNKNKRHRASSPSRNSKAPSPKISSRMYTQQELNTPPIRFERNIEATPEPSTPKEKEPFRTALALNEFYQQQPSTPQRMEFAIPSVIYSSPPLVSFPSEQVFDPPIALPTVSPSSLGSSTPLITGVYGSAVAQPQLAPQVLVVNAQNQLEIQSSMHLMNQVFCKNGVMQLPQFQSIVVQVPTIDLLQNRINLSSIIAPPTEAPVEACENLTDSEKHSEREKSQKHYKKGKLTVFEYLEAGPPAQEESFDNLPPCFTPKQRSIYEQQMRIHAQLLSQNFMQVFANPKWWQKSETIKQNIVEIQSAVNPEFSPDTSKHIEECLKLCNEWENQLEDNNDRNKNYAEFLYEEHDLDVAAFEGKLQFKGRFHPRLMEHVLSSKAIIYPKLLPKVPFRVVSFKKVEPPNSELQLLAFGLERFYREQYESLNSLNPYRLRVPRYGSLCRDIVREFKSFRNSKALVKIVEGYKNHKRMNPIKYFFIHKKAPAYVHEIEEVDLDVKVPPKNLRRGLLPKIWDSYMFSHERLQVHPYVLPVKEQAKTQDIAEEKTLEPTEHESQVVNEIPTTEVTVINDQYKIEILYDDIPKINICVIPKTPEKVPEVKISCISLSSPKVKEKSAEEKQKNLISILKKVTDSLEKSPKQKKSVNFLLPSPRVNRSSPRFVERTKEIANSFLLSQKFFIVIESFFTNFSKNISFRDTASPLLIRFYHWTKTIDIYLKLVQQSMMISKKRQNEASTSDATTKPKKNVSSSEEYSKRLHRKLTENRNLIMQSERNKCTTEKDCSYAYNYLERLKKTLLENGDEELYKDFMSMLTSFDPDFETVPQLYYKIESLLLPNYSDLVDLFLTFLLPEHAAEIGKFFEHFCLSNMANLLKKLNFYFSKQPSHMKKVYSVLNDLSNEEDLTLDRLKTKVLPLLKGNQLLIDWFMELFGNPIDSLPSEYENVYIKKSLSDSDNSIDNYEEIYSQDLIECKNIDDLNYSCGVKYKNGKLMYHGTLLPAKISFLALDSPSPSSSKSEEHSLCMHEIRKHVKFNDPKKLEEIVDDTKKPKAKKYKLCDSQTLHAHAVRLNSIHAQNGEKLPELAHLLTPTSQSNGSDERNSPKKTRNAKKSGNSPKKTLNKSPILPLGHSTVPPLTDSPSKALQTAKKLRTLIDDDEQRNPKRKRKGGEATELISAKATKKSKMYSKKSTESSRNVEENSKLNASSSKDTANTSDWTREEDKIILEEINVGKSNEILLDTLEQKLTTRLRDEINNRRIFLLEVVNNHRKGDK